MFHKLLITTCAVFALLFRAEGQLYTFRCYTDDNGLGQNYVYSLSQNEQGFLFIGTGEGFTVFEGDRFHNYTTSDGLAENFVTAHLTTKDRTYIGHFQGGISIYRDRRFSKLKSSVLEGVKINGFFEDKESNVFVYTQGKGLYKIGAAAGKRDLSLQPYANPLANGINHVAVDNANDFLIGTNDGLIVLDYTDGNHYTTIPSPAELEYKTITRIVKGNRQGTLFWVGVEGEGLYSIIRKGKRYVVNSFLSAEELGATDFKMTSMICDHEQNLWLGFLGDGLREVLFTGSDKNTRLVKKIGTANGFDNRNIQSIFQDKEGNMWLGTFGGGLYLKTIQPFVYYNGRNGLSNSNIKAVVNTDDNMLWIGTETGLTTYNLTTNAIRDYGPGDGFVHDEVSCIKRSANGELWIGTRSSGVYTYDPRTGRFTSFSKAHGLKSLSVNAIELTAYGAVYIGTTDGLYIYNRKTNSLQFRTTLEGLMHNNVRGLFLDSQNRLWIASPGSPPYYYSGGNFRSFRDIEEMRNYKITGYAEDGDGAIWIGTEGDGCFRYRGGTFTHYAVKHGLKSNYVYGIVYDGEQTVWITHKDGLSKFNLETAKFSQVDRSRGNLKFTENNFNSFYCDASHTLFFGTTKGLIVYYNNQKLRGQLPPTSITGVFFDGKAFDHFNDIALDYKRYNVLIRFKGIAFSDQQGVQYKYRLLGLDEEWRITSNDFVDYPKLGDGTYTFELLAANPQGEWTKEPVRMTFTIAAPYWKTWWFYLAVVTLTFLVVSWIIRYRLRTLGEAKLRLEAVVAEKTQELQAEKQVIETIKNELEDKNRNITDSINYALRIQKAILPESSDIVRCFPDSTIFYQPRDIVSGDFYWFTETEGYCYYALVDCTGHGIPGAFMSLIGSTLLNEIIRQDPGAAPAEMLYQLNQRIVQTLKQDSGNNSRDGMDMILCRFDKSSPRVVFASAGRPLFHVSRNELTAYRASLSTIGGSYDFIKKRFENHEIELSKGDLIALFSDGFPDQFGEKEQKKYSSLRVKQLCLEVAGLDPEPRNKRIQESFFGWKGESEQIDDVLFVTIKA